MPAADFPPNSNIPGLSSRPQAPATSLPEDVEPVNDTLSTPGLVTRARPMSVAPGNTLKTPAGSPALSATSASSSASSGVSGDGLSTTVLPAASAGTYLNADSVCGKFHGVIAATTPTGQCVTRARVPAGLRLVSLIGSFSMRSA